MPDDLKRPRLSRLQWRIFALACGTSFLLYLHRYSWNIVGPSLQKDYGLSNTQAGFLFSLFNYTYAVGQIPSGVLIDRFGPHLFLSVAIVAWSSALAAIGRSASLPLIGGSRLLFGVAQAGCYPALTKVTRIWFDPARRTVLQGWIATTAGRAGGAMAPIVLGTVLVGWCKLSWETALGILGLIGVVYGLVFWTVYRDTPPASSAPAPAAAAAVAVAERGPPPVALPWGRAWRNSSLRFFTAQQFLDAGSDVAFQWLIGTYFLMGRGFDIIKTGWLASLPLWGGAFGGIVGGWLNDRSISWTGNRRWSRSGVGCIGKLIGGVMMALAVGQSNGVAAAGFLCAAKFFSDWSQPTTWGTCTDLGGRFSATVFSIINTAGTLGAIVMPLVYGKVLDRFTTHSALAVRDVATTDWSPLFFLLSAMYLGSGVCWLLVDCTRTIQDE
jgi:MFS transporter, ACS family, glucarate transporter